MTRTQLAVPVIAALVGSAITAAALTATRDSGSNTGARQQGLFASSPSAPEDSSGRLTPREIYDRSAASVVAIRARALRTVASPFGAAETGPTVDASTGSGFVLDDEGYVVTAARVVSGVTDVQVIFPDLRSVPARVVGKDEETDLALLLVDPRGLDLRPLELGDSAAVRPGDRLVTIGNPGGYGATAGTGTVTEAVGRVETPQGSVLRDAIAIDAVIEPSSAGGPVIGADGRVIGISSDIGAEDSGAGYAVAADTAESVLAQLRADHRLVRPYLGIRGRTLDRPQATADGGAAAGVEVLEVYPGGPAAQAGLRGDETNGDVIEGIDGRTVTSLTELMTEVDRHQPGEVVHLTVLRDGNRGDVAVTLAERPASLPAG
jgi:S1-C subfamily serine protease